MQVNWLILISLILLTVQCTVKSHAPFPLELDLKNSHLCDHGSHVEQRIFFSFCRNRYLLTRLQEICCLKSFMYNKSYDFCTVFFV